MTDHSVAIEALEAEISGYERNIVTLKEAIARSEQHLERTTRSLAEDEAAVAALKASLAHMRETSHSGSTITLTIDGRAVEAAIADARRRDGRGEAGCCG